MRNLELITCLFFIVATALAQTQKAPVSQTQATQLRVPAILIPDRDRMAYVSTQFRGSAVRILKTIGDFVKKGEVLVELECIEFAKAVSEYLSAKADYTMALRKNEWQQKVFANTLKLLELTRDRPSLQEATGRTASLNVGSIKTLLLRSLGELQSSGPALSTQKKLHALQEWQFKDAQKFLEILKDNPMAVEARKRSEGLQLGKWRSEVLNALAELELVRAIFKRKEELLQQNVGTQAEYLKAKTRLDTAQMSYTSVVQQLQIESESKMLEQKKNLLEAKQRFMDAETAFNGAREVASFKTEINRLESEKLQAKTTARLSAVKRQLHLFGFTGEAIAALKPDMDGLTTRSILSPMDGVIIQRTLTVGEVAEPGQLLFTILDRSVLWASASLFDRDLPRVREGQKVCLSWDALPGRSFEGKVIYVGRRDEKVRQTSHESKPQLLISVPNPDGLLRRGLYVMVEMETKD